MVEGNLIFTIGHSNRSLKEFLHILDHYDIECLVDIRHYPGSRYNPHFSGEKLEQSLKKKKISYLHLENLGGRRKPDLSSNQNAGWRSPQFKGYADHMQTSAFEKSFKKLIKLAEKKIVVIMCSEAVPWRCHRNLVGDMLQLHGFSVLDIFSEKVVEAHRFTPFAEVKKGRLTYPAYESSSSRIGQSGL